MSETRDVLERHLQAMGRDVDAIMKDYSQDSVLVTPDATYRGLEEIRAFFTVFLHGLPAEFWENFKLKRQEIVEEVAYILWEAGPLFPLGSDTYFIKRDKILYQTYAAFRP